eukprot:14413608-Alexandrium_andersonii.AAC.1
MSRGQVEREAIRARSEVFTDERLERQWHHESYIWNPKVAAVEERMLLSRHFAEQEAEFELQRSERLQ